MEEFVMATIDKERQKLVEKYFYPTPKTPVRGYITLGVGLLLLIVGASGSGFFAFVGVVLLLWGGYLFAKYGLRYLAAHPKATDEQMQRWLDEKIDPIIESGLLRLNVHPSELSASLPKEQQYLVFVGIPDPDSMLVREARGKDGVARYSHYRIMVVYLSKERLPLYECYLDMATGALYQDATREYGLDKVDGMETASDRLTAFASAAQGPNAQQNAGSLPSAIGTHTLWQVIRLKVSGMTAIRLVITVADTEVVQLASNGEGVAGSKLDRNIAMLREHLRAVRAGLLGQNSLPGAAPEASLGLPQQNLGAPDLSLPPAGPSDGAL
jgi:hypothetical protein